MIKKILFVCEGTTELYLLYKILKKNDKVKVNEEIEENGNIKMSNLKLEKYIFSNEDIEIFAYNLEGVSNLKEFIENISKIRIFSELRKILFIFDADYSKSENETGYEQRKTSIEHHKESLVEGNKKLEIEYFITPNNKDDGMTEDLIINSLKCTEIVKYMKRVIKEVKEMKEAEIKNESKSLFMMVAATQNPLKGTAPVFLSGCYDKIDKGCADFQKIVKFIEKEIDIENK